MVMKSCVLMLLVANSNILVHCVCLQCDVQTIHTAYTGPKNFALGVFSMILVLLLYFCKYPNSPNKHNCSHDLFSLHD